VEFMVDNKRFALSPRQVTVSTVGVLKNMQRLTAELPFVNLALSLHAPNQQVRLKIVPAASSSPIEQLMAALDNHIKHNLMVHCHQDDDLSGGVRSGSRRGGGQRQSKTTGAMIEYILIKDINDSPEHAIELGELLCKSPYKQHILLNLIPYNPTAVAADFHPPSSSSVTQFSSILTSAPFGLHTRVRQEKGQDIAGACGQLALVSGESSKKSHVSSDLEDMAGKKNSLRIPRKPLKSSHAESVSNIQQVLVGGMEQLLKGFERSSFETLEGSLKTRNGFNKAPTVQRHSDRDGVSRGAVWCVVNLSLCVACVVYDTILATIQR